MKQMTIVVKFEYASVYSHDKLFMQPLFYIAMNEKHRLLKTHGQTYNEQMLTPDLEIISNNILNLEIAPSSCLNETDFHLNYLMDRYNSDVEIKYKGALFKLTIDKSPGKQHSFKVGCDSHTVTSIYEISYAEKDFALFEDFVKASVFYFKKFVNGEKIDKKRLKMFISSEDGGYFESIGTRPKRSLESVFLPPAKKKEIINIIEKFIEPATVQSYNEYGINHKLTILLEGPPGTGKSSLIAAIASYFNFNIALVSFTPKMTDVGFMRSMRTFNAKIHREASDDNPKDKEERGTILVIDDMECIFKERKAHDEQRNSVTFSGILNALDGITTADNQIVIMSTNHIGHLDPALIRPGRVDHIMHFDYATKEQIKEMFLIYTKGDQNTTEEKRKTTTQTFHVAIQDLNIKISTCLLQQYLLKYANKIDLIMENIDEMKVIYASCNKQNADETKMYT